jgi:hypothetical protein
VGHTPRSQVLDHALYLHARQLSERCGPDPQRRDRGADGVAGERATGRGAVAMDEPTDTRVEWVRLVALTSALSDLVLNLVHRLQHDLDECLDEATTVLSIQEGIRLSELERLLQAVSDSDQDVGTYVKGLASWAGVTTELIMRAHLAGHAVPPAWRTPPPPELSWQRALIANARVQAATSAAATVAADLAERVPPLLGATEEETGRRYLETRVRDRVRELAECAQRAGKTAAQLAARTVKLTGATDEEWRRAVDFVRVEWEARPSYWGDDRLQAGSWSW